MPQALSARELAGLQIAAMARLRRRGEIWLVPSHGQRRGGSPYQVTPHPIDPRCTCPDHALHGGKCKHIYAVEFALRRESEQDGGPVYGREMRTEPPPRKTYRQDWAAYNAAQTREKALFQILLRDLVRGTTNEQFQARRKGRPRVPLQDVLFCTCFKVYVTFSGRRFMTDLGEAQVKGYISSLLHFNTIFNYLGEEELTPILMDLVVRSSAPLAGIETTFALDSSGFSSSSLARWFDEKHKKLRQEHDWVKVHIACGVKTNVVTGVVIGGRNAPDGKQLPKLLEQTAKNFNIREVCADKGYSSIASFDHVESHDAVPYIAFMRHVTGRGSRLWERMFMMLQSRQDEFLKHYHQRSNVESVFSTIKRKFGDNVRSKSQVAMKNEVLCKCICHNICVLIQESHELGIEIDFDQPATVQ